MRLTDIQHRLMFEILDFIVGDRKGGAGVCIAVKPRTVIYLCDQIWQR